MIISLSELQKQAFQNEIDKGFSNGMKFEGAPSQGEFYRRITLLHSELSELVETYRKNALHNPTDKLMHFDRLYSNADEELADIAIRLGGLAEWLGVDLESAVNAKMRYNATRSFMHGKNS